MENFNNKDISVKISEPGCSNNVIVINDDQMAENSSNFANYYESLIPPAEDDVFVENYDIPIIGLLRDQKGLNNLQNSACNKFMRGECTIIKLPMNHNNIIHQNSCIANYSSMRLQSNPQQYNSMPLPCINFQGRKRRTDYCAPYISGPGVKVVATDKRIYTPETSTNPQTPESRQLEVLRAAKSLFSKRTRTLFHWMYPGAPKAQIKAAVAASWSKLGTQEKDFYISQVLGRFGFPQSRLMVNPQLNSIRVPPAASCELQEAISSITDSSVTFPTAGANFVQRKRRQGRPRSDKETAKVDAETRQSGLDFPFQDDPELSQELNQFALTLNLSKNPMMLKF